ncbi:cupin domain-containing protein [Arenimonas sp.]|nr:cupin domain-containing protein [Candidatus Parcubacteria bacterium]
MKKGYKGTIEQLTLANENFRKVLYTGAHMQLVLMSLKPLEDIGLEIHQENDQFFRFEKGNGKVIVGETEYKVVDGDVVIVPAGVQHNVINISEVEDLKMYTIYSPAHHKDGIVRFTKKDALENDEEFDGVKTED